LGLGGADAVTSAPSVSVIVPVRDRRVLLRSLLEALAKQTYRDFEVVVVDDGSRDGSGDEADTFGDIAIRVVRTEGVGAVAARRAGVAASAGHFLAFTDSDCEPDADWLQEGVAALEAGADLAQGTTTPIGSVGSLQRSVWVDHEDGLYATCNVFYRRGAYDEAGGFDIHGGHLFGFRSGPFARGLGFGEDTLLGWRVRRSGRAVFVPKAVVRHQVVSQSGLELLRRAWIAGAFPTLVREVPELRKTLLHAGIFLGRRRIPLYATLGALATRRRALSAAALAWWAVSRARDSKGAGATTRDLAVAIPVELAVDVVTAAALFVGSARARNIVL
jgi:glycosyltransferase involved in cell wall biosynthesis